MSVILPLTSRRIFLKKSLALSAVCLLERQAIAEQAPVRSLALENIHTGESLKLDYWEQGSYINESLQEINHLLRDHRANEVHPIDLSLIDQLYQLKRVTGSNRSFEVISGYRSPATNEMLRKLSNGVAKNSLHILGKAIDIHLPGLSLQDLRDAALSMKSGGVGLYRQFVHIDTGRVRYW